MYYLCHSVFVWYLVFIVFGCGSLKIVKTFQTNNSYSLKIQENSYLFLQITHCKRMNDKNAKRATRFTFGSPSFLFVGLSPTVISFVLSVCTGHADSKQRSRWVSTRHVLLRACPKKSQAQDGPRRESHTRFSFFIVGLSPTVNTGARVFFLPLNFSYKSTATPIAIK